ncbi:hypothetical protein M0811_11995 [Anaeramoeba ignava]|uniref:Uncharacterized protein n=1 Tax=Anaeramoeba ignava TaxID=1746090 RepID=A0A9Q0LB18_ANAIG|nr:hypothetical protein M0811_11995 [Anaeramoeba ignava]
MVIQVIILDFLFQISQDENYIIVGAFAAKVGNDNYIIVGAYAAQTKCWYFSNRFWLGVGIISRKKFAIIPFAPNVVNSSEQGKSYVFEK